jgi:gamma-glutamylcyclotransferase (GGCT)/AIG2-like uncharacterized protein YtfP
VFVKLFVYGTLKRGDSRSRFLHGQRFLGEGCTLPNCRLYNCGSYPALVRDDHDGRAIEGEVWDVDAACLKTLDEVEGTSEGLYLRALIELESPFDGQRIETYLYAGSTKGLADCGCRWE